MFTLFDAFCYIRQLQQIMKICMCLGSRFFDLLQVLVHASLMFSSLYECIHAFFNAFKSIGIVVLLIESFLLHFCECQGKKYPYLRNQSINVALCFQAIGLILSSFTFSRTFLPCSIQDINLSIVSDSGYVYFDVLRYKSYEWLAAEKVICMP